MTKPAFNIKSKVYHIILITPESPEGIVIDVKYKYATQTYAYQVAFNPFQVSLWYYDTELSYNKSF